MSKPEKMDECRCGRWLHSEIERDLGTCNRCLDAEYEREQERREFAYYHPTGAAAIRNRGTEND